MATMDDLPDIHRNTLRHKKSLTEDTLEQMVANNPIPITKNHSYHNGKSNPLKKKAQPHNGLIKKRKSEAALYINTSTLFPLHTSNKDHTNHNKINGHHTHVKKSHSGRYSHHHTLLQNKTKRLTNKRRSYNPYNAKDKYEAFDFNAYRQKQQQNKDKQQKQEQFVSNQTRRRAITVNPPHSKPFKKMSDRNKPTKSTSPKSVKFSPKTAMNNRSAKTKNPGISFRKSHNNLPIMNPDEAMNIKKKKKKFNLYKQRASYSAAHFSKHKHQLLSQRSKKHHNNAHYGGHSGIHTTNSHAMKEDEAFVNSLLEPIKKKELHEAIQKLKEVIESAQLTNLCGSTVEMTLREVLRKLQLLRLEVTLREYRQHSAATDDTNTTTDDEVHPTGNNINGIGPPISMMASQSFESKLTNLHLDEIIEEKLISNEPIAESPPETTKKAQLELETKEVPKAIEVEMKTNKTTSAKTEKEKAIEEEQIRILNAIENEDDKNENVTDRDLVSALLFASNYHRNHYEIDGKHVIATDNSDATPKRKITLTRRRFTLSAAKPTDSDRVGIEVAQWLSTRYSTFGRYEIPPSPLSQPIESLSPRNNNDKKHMNQLSLNNEDSSEIYRKENEKRKKLFDEKKRKVSLTRIDINRFLKFITSDQILMKLHGIGDNWEWCTFELHDICGDSILLITAHYIFEQLNLFEKFSISYNKFQSFFSVIQRGYEKNPYHSSLHAADVLINIYFWIKSDHEFRSYLSDLDIIIALISAACHDYMHPGLTQNFQIATNSDMALKYNGRSVLENMHCSETIRLLLRPEYAVFESLKKSEFRYVRELITDMILGTDMQMHSDHVKMSNELCALYEDASKKKEIDKEKHTKHVLVVGLHVADIANPCKPWLDCKRWTYMLMEEWFRQGDKEKKMGLEVSPMMDRSKPNIPRGQVGFIDYIVKPIFVNWNTLFPQTSICLQHLQNNRENWNQCNSDPNANNVQYNLSQLSTNPNGLKLLQLHEPIGLDHPNHTPVADDDDAVFQTAIIVKKENKNKRTKKRNRNKKKQKVKRQKVGNSKPSLKVSITKSNKEESNAVNEVKAVPFTPEQAEALHVSPTYSDAVSSDNDHET